MREINVYLFHYSHQNGNGRFFHKRLKGPLPTAEDICQMEKKIEKQYPVTNVTVLSFCQCADETMTQDQWSDFSRENSII